MATKNEYDCRTSGLIWNSSTQSCYDNSSTASCVQTDGHAWVNGTCQNSPLAFTQIAVGAGHACGLTSNGAAYCWGQGTNGQLGVGASTSFLAPTAVSGGLSFSKISAGYSHTCGITTSGVAYCWGYNGNGTLGNNSTTSSNVPVAVSGGLTFSQVSVGSQHTCGITTSGEAYCWGYNLYGQLGDNSNVTAGSKVPVAVSGGLTFSKISAGYSHTCGITTSGTAYCWGYGSDYQLGRNSTATAIAPAAVSGGLAFTEIAAGFRHSCGISTSGSTYCWGSGYSGQLGGSSSQSTTPQLVTSSASLDFQKIVAAQSHTCGITASGVAYCWGNNSTGETGVLSGYGGTITQPTQVSTTKTFTQIQTFAGGSSTCGLNSSGEAYCWGQNIFALSGIHYSSVGLDYALRAPMAIPPTTPCGIPGYVWNNSTQTCVDGRPTARSSFTASSNVLSWTPDNSGSTSFYRIWRGGLSALGYCTYFNYITTWLAPVSSTYTDSANTSIETTSCYFIESCSEAGCRASSVLAGVYLACSSATPQACTDSYSCSSNGGTWGSVDYGSNYSCYANSNSFATACSNNGFSYAYGGSCYSDVSSYCSAQGAPYSFSEQCYWDYNAYLCASSGLYWSWTTSSCYLTQDEANCATGGGTWFNSWCYYDANEYNCAQGGGAWDGAMCQY